MSAGQSLLPIATTVAATLVLIAEAYFWMRTQSYEPPHDAGVSLLLGVFVFATSSVADFIGVPVAMALNPVREKKEIA